MDCLIFVGKYSKVDQWMDIWLIIVTPANDPPFNSQKFVKIPMPNIWDQLKYTFFIFVPGKFYNKDKNKSSVFFCILAVKITKWRYNIMCWSVGKWSQESWIFWNKAI